MPTTSPWPSPPASWCTALPWPTAARPPCSSCATSWAGGSIRCTGWTEPSGRIGRPLRPAEGGEPRPAHSGYRRLATVELPVAVSRYPTSRYALLAVCPLTGRRHQIRRHLASIAHPVLGDTTHGDGRHNRMFRERFGLYRLALHAQWMGFRQPLTGEFVSIHCPPSPDLQALGGRLGWQRWLGEAVEGGAPPGC